MPIGGYNWTLPLLQQINRQGDLMMYADQARRANERNAMERKLYDLRFQEMQRAQHEKNALRTQFSGVGADATPEQIARLIMPFDPKTGATLLQSIEAAKQKNQPTYDIKETAEGFKYFPKQPGTPAIPTGEKGKPEKWNIYPPQPTGSAPTKAPSGYRYNAGGELEPIPGGPADAKNKPNTKAPAGFRWTDDGNLEAIPGGPADEKTRVKYSQDVTAKDSMLSELDRLASAASEIKDDQALWRITGLAGKLPNMPGSAAADVEAKLEVLKSQTAFSTLQAMRNASKTGGALGQVSEKEISLLENNLAALSKAQSPEAYKASLQKIIDFVEKSKSRINNSFSTRWGNFGNTAEDYLNRRFGTGD